MLDDGPLSGLDGRRNSLLVFDFSTIQNTGGPQLMRVTEDGQRLSITTNQAGKRAMLYTSGPTHPTALDILDLGPNSCPHYPRLTADEKRLMISDYSSHDFTQGDHQFRVAPGGATSRIPRSIPTRRGRRSGIQVGQASGRGVPNAAR
jgi:hypothetical protein